MLRGGGSVAVLCSCLAMPGCLDVDALTRGAADSGTRDASVDASGTDARMADAPATDVDAVDAPDTDGAVPSACAGWPLRVEATGTTVEAIVSGLAADGEGGLYLAGRFVGTIAVGDESATNSDVAPDVFVARVEGDGAVAWLTAFPTSSNERLYVARDSLGPVVAGTFSGSFHGNVSAGGTDAFILLLRADGGMRGSGSFGGTGNETVFGVAIGADATYVAAAFDSASFTLESSPVVHTDGGASSDILVATHGGSSWVAHSVLGGPGMQAPRGIGIGAGQVYVTGIYDAAFAGLPAASALDAFVLTLDPSTLELRTTVPLSGSGDDQALAIAVGSDRLYVAGTFASPILAGIPNVMNPEPTTAHGFVVTMFHDLSLAGGVSLGGVQDDAVFAVATGGGTRAIATGRFLGMASVGARLVTSRGAEDAFAAALEGTRETPEVSLLEQLGGGSRDVGLAATFSIASASRAFVAVEHDDPASASVHCYELAP